MKLCTKRIYCPSCKRLVKGRERQDEGDRYRVHILCSRCDRLLYTWNGITWKYARGRV